MVKRFMSVLILSAVLSIASMIFSSPVSAEWTKFGLYTFKTNDGRWDGQMYVKSNGGNVVVRVATPRTVNVRLCSANTGNCTSYKSNNQSGIISYYNLIGGKYYGDVSSPYNLEGTIGFSVYNKK
ncbi:hypothetical protein [Gracilibacillus salitolerans]|nr:hypothetical protein [Gracilibacillus salitolerans]